MAKLKAPLWSVSASGKIAGSLLYSRQRGIDRVTGKRFARSVTRTPQRRQSSIISEAARLWKTPAGRGPETSYREYVAGISREPWLFAVGAILLEWNDQQLMTAR